MKLERELGTYGHTQMTLRGSFQLGNPPTVFRDGTNVVSSGKWFQVARVSAGLFTITFQDQNPIPDLPFIHVSIAQGAAPAVPCIAREVVGSWNPAFGNRSFQIQVQTIGTTPAASDGNAGDRVTFTVSGSCGGAGVDPA